MHLVLRIYPGLIRIQQCGLYDQPVLCAFNASADAFIIPNMQSGQL